MTQVGSYPDSSETCALRDQSACGEITTQHGGAGRRRQELERRGHIVAGVATTTAARQRVAAGDCDLIISDLGLPDGDGHKLMAELHDRYGLPGIALSGYGMEHDIARSRVSGFFTHLTKPVDIRVLESAIAAAPHPGAVIQP